MAVLTRDPGPAAAVPVRPGVPDDVARVVASAFEEEWGRVVATLIRLTGDWALAEECAQDAFAAALERWPRDGVPQRPGAWLTTTARNRALDRLRRSRAESAKLREVAVLGSPDSSPDDGAADDDASLLVDDRLQLLFTCCHPALALESRVALTLRTLAGLTVAEIARAFLVSEAAMTKRLTRARQKIRHAAIPYRVPPDHLLPERTSGVLAVLYLTFSEGYAPTSGAEVVREPLSREAIRLTRVLAQLMPDEPEVLGLLALMLLQDARRAARTDDAGDLVTLEAQDRTRWDADQVAAGVAVLAEARRRSGDDPGPYELQAGIAACHATAADAASTDWRAIVRHYDALAGITDSPVVTLNRAVAVAMVDGPEAGLALVDDLAASGRLAGYHLLAATRADLLRRLGRRPEAAAAYRDALAPVPDGGPTDAERRYLRRRLTEMEDT